jgi:glycosyltransferase involved in cell wall biosynthesis
MIRRARNLPRLVFCGYPSDLKIYTGGFLWMKRVADYVEKNGCYSVAKISRKPSKMLVNDILVDLKNIIQGLFSNPDIVVLDSWWESNIILWLILRLFKPKIKVMAVFHHYEPKIPHCRNILQSCYNNFFFKATRSMLKDCDVILTVSNASKQQLIRVYGICDGYAQDPSVSKQLVKRNINKIKIVGTGLVTENFGGNYSHNVYDGKKEIDFLCIGRTEKFIGLENIWKIIKSVRKSRFVMAGPATSHIIKKLHGIGIEHKGFVTEEEKFNLYLKSKVFIYPSRREGFGIAVAEALLLGLPVVAWRIPVFEELYSQNCHSSKMRLIKFEDYKLFAEESIGLTHKTNPLEIRGNGESKNNSLYFPNWNCVGQNVLSTIDSIK